MEYKFYNNSIEFYTDVKQIIPELDINKTLHFLDQSFMLGDKFYSCMYLDEALKEFNTLLGKNYYCVDKSQLYNEMYTIFFSDEEVVAPEEEITPVSTSPLISLTSSEEDVTDETITEATVIEDTQVTPTVDWGWVDSLENNKEDKLKLDKYAEGFDIKINRAKTLPNMIKAFKVALDK
jgi:hypothetical protein